MNKTILFIGHEASATGAPTSLLRIITWFKQNTNYNIKILLKKNGFLVDKYQELGQVYVCKYAFYKISPPNGFLKHITWSVHYRINRKIINGNYLLKNELKKQYQNANINIIFCNTSTNGRLLEALSFLNVPVVARIAELPFLIKNSFSYEFSFYEKYVNQYIAVSNNVKNALAKEFNIKPTKISVVHGAVDIKEKVKPVDLKKELHIPENSIIIAGSGTDLIRKGSDLFIHTANLICKHFKKKNIHFIWLGGKQNFFLKQLEQDIELAQLSENIHFLEHKKNALPYFAAIDIFFLPSREDPFPLVALEAAYFNKPVLCFEKAGGMPEFVETDAGFIIPYLDLYKAAKKIIELTENKDLRIKLGNNAYKKVKEQYHYDIVGNKFHEIIEKTIR